MVVHVSTGWQRLIGCLQLQIVFRKRATSYRALLRNTTYDHKASYDSLPPCKATCITHLYTYVHTLHSLTYTHTYTCIAKWHTRTHTKTYTLNGSMLVRTQRLSLFRVSLCVYEFVCVFDTDLIVCACVCM